jgi:hypothetical protein
MVVVFGGVAAVLMRIIPEPKKETDYLVIGTLATVAALGVLFVALIRPYLEGLFKRREPGS